MVDDPASMIFHDSRPTQLVQDLVSTLHRALRVLVRPSVLVRRIWFRGCRKLPKNLEEPTTSISDKSEVIKLQFPVAMSTNAQISSISD